jgi:hypothetical protein
LLLLQGAGYKIQYLRTSRTKFLTRCLHGHLLSPPPPRLPPQANMADNIPHPLHTQGQTHLPPPSPPPCTPHLCDPVSITAAVWCSHTDEVAGRQASQCASGWVVQRPDCVSSHESPHAVCNDGDASKGWSPCCCHLAYLIGQALATCVYALVGGKPGGVCVCVGGGG